MGFASNLNLFNCESVFTWAKAAIGGSWYKLIVAAVIVILIGVLVSLFLNTRLGLSIRATGDNPDMVRASSINTGFMITIGLCVANALTALSGGLLAQYQKSCDINLGTDRQGGNAEADFGRNFRKLSVPLYRSHCPEDERSCRVPEVSFFYYRSSCHCASLPEKEILLFKAEEGGKAGKSDLSGTDPGRRKRR